MTSKKEERGFWDRHRNRISGRAEGEQEELAERGVCWGTPCGPEGTSGGPVFPGSSGPQSPAE